jgi:uncharacterized membrane protein (DUF373 family)
MRNTELLDGLFSMDLSRIFEGMSRVALCGLLLAIFLGLLGGVVATFYHLRFLFTGNVKEVIRVLILDSLTLLALIEVFKTTLLYFKEGRVLVTYIVDTVMVVVLTEIMAYWFKELDYLKVGFMVVLIFFLSFVRIMAIRYSPSHRGEGRTV